jgi:very-short-patch-repair endonuclease
MALRRRRYLAYRASLTPRARSLRRDPTPAERKLWYEFLRDLPQKFTRQKPLGRYIVDFYCSPLQLAIELDGDSHYADGAQAYDAMRSAELEHRGVRVLRFTNAEVMQQFEAACLEIRRAIEGSG